MTEYVSVGEFFGGVKRKWKALPKWKKIGYAIGIAMILIAFIGLATYYAGIIVPATKEITIKAHPYLGEFDPNTNITVTLFDKNKVQIATVVLTAPTWSAVVRDLNIKGYYYISAKATGFYWMYWVTSNDTSKLPDGTIVIAKNVSSAVESLDLYFIKVGSVQWVDVYGLNNLADGTKTTMILTYKFNLTAQSAIDNLTVVVTVNSTELNVTGIIFDTTEYAVNSTIADFLINPNATAVEYEVSLKIVENITAPVLVTVTLQYLDEKGETVEVSAEVVFS